MKKIFLICVLCIVFFSSITHSQQSQTKIYKVYEREISDCGNDKEEIILYTDSTFCVITCIGGISVQGRGGWWIKDSVLILQSSRKCAGPLLLSKEEYREKESNETHIEVYNEEGKLLHYSTIDNNNNVKTIFDDGCILLKINKTGIHLQFIFVIKGRALPVIKTNKRNNTIVLTILEPYTSIDIYMGKQSIMLADLTEKKGHYRP